MDSSNGIDILCEVDPSPLIPEHIITFCKGVLYECDADHELSIYLCGDTRMRQLNQDFRRIDKTTDVLSFPDSENGSLVRPSGKFLGDIALSIPQIQLQAKEYNISFAEEFRRMLIHGILHLLGYDHEVSAKEEDRMKKEEERVLLSTRDIPLC